ncbi:hypothetical protein BAUCODRAFT_156498 [Baudoinia panamericana UAMH 10762]|uniref:Uncharacterized protein n=1 Tax=Baudoinia panamericana (strain UAMH 10762) TaxID=717646 RepID=M2NBL9_BAUPA|nr:uncharacterized protein BAUCODRAFT_156498 [Baudoinia panamericana UAMH 10762]EMC96305.1 hypothetical protein BAUCODRAFT_156498 [Baudoinia panamericana UAMH 10762]
MRRSLIRMAQYGLESEGARGVRPPFHRRRVDYQSFKSQFGPEYKIGWHAYGLNMTQATRYMSLAAGMGISLGIFGIFFLDAVPRVQRDILQKLPFIGSYFVHEVPPEDNPF